MQGVRPSPSVTPREVGEAENPGCAGVCSFEMRSDPICVCVLAFLLSWCRVGWLGNARLACVSVDHERSRAFGQTVGGGAGTLFLSCLCLGRWLDAWGHVSTQTLLLLRLLRKKLVISAPWPTTCVQTAGFCASGGGRGNWPIYCVVAVAAPCRPGPGSPLGGRF
jgi:hypothetical protein